MIACLACFRRYSPSEWAALLWIRFGGTQRAAFEVRICVCSEPIAHQVALPWRRP